MTKALGLYDEFLHTGGRERRWDARSSEEYRLLVLKLRQHAKSTLHAQEHYMVKAQERVPGPMSQR